LLADGVEVVRATVLKVRVGAPAPRGVDAPELELPLPARATALRGPSRTPSAFLDGISMRVASGDPTSPGPAAIWFRADRPLIEGEQTSPLMRAALTADFANGAAAAVDPREWTFINADLTLSVTRAPVGDWILLDAETWLGRDGVALASARLADTTGYFGRAAQSLLIEPRQHRKDG
jgi:Thioesterase-like superfamily